MKPEIVMEIIARARKRKAADEPISDAQAALIAMAESPVQMRLRCPGCGALHVDEGEFATKPHHTHACQECGEVWRPALLPTVGVRFLPGFKNP